MQAETRLHKLSTKWREWSRELEKEVKCGTGDTYRAARELELAMLYRCINELDEAIIEICNGCQNE